MRPRNNFEEFQNTWLGFGGLAVTLSSAAQGEIFTPVLSLAMPITGLSTLVFAWGGEMVDAPYDREASKRGLVLRMGMKKATYALALIHVLMIVNVLSVVLFITGGTVILYSLVPYLIVLISALRILFKDLESREKIKKGAGLSFFSFVLFSLGLVNGFSLLLVV